MRSYVLSENNWKNLKDQKIELAILPWGATEAHNYHLPYGTDNIQAESIAIESARIANEKGANAVVMPVIPFGVNTGQSDIKLTMNLNPGTQAMILHDFAESLARQEIYKLLILNGHGGNDFRQILREIGYNYPDMFFCCCNWFQAVDKAGLIENEGDHADEVETSLMQYLAPELVLPLSEAGDGSSKKFRVKALNEKWAWAERKWTSVTKDTGIGDPGLSTREKGKKIFEMVTQKTGELILELSEMDLGDVYE